MKDNTIKADQDKTAEVYENKVMICVDEYIQNLDARDDDERTLMMRKPPVFRGMCKYIFEHVFKIGKGEIRYNNKCSNIDYADVDMLNSVWSMYTSLCYKYLSSPTLLNFSIFSGIDKSTLVSWDSGEYRDDSNTNDMSTYTDSTKSIEDSKVSNNIYIYKGQQDGHANGFRRDEVGSSHSASVKKWKSECEAALYDVAMCGGIGGMFLLKANYGYSEGAQQITLTNGDAGKTIDQIAAEHRPQIAQDDNDQTDNAPPAADF